jgi:hypothetical protein
LDSDRLDPAQTMRGGLGTDRGALTPWFRLIAEPTVGPMSTAILGTGERVLFGLGLAYGLMRHPRVRQEPHSRRI